MVLGLPVNIFIITSDNICEDIAVLFENLKQSNKSLLSYFISGGIKPLVMMAEPLPTTYSYPTTG